MYCEVIFLIFFFTETIPHTPRDDVLIDIDDKEPLIPGQVEFFSLYIGSSNFSNRPH